MDKALRLFLFLLLSLTCHAQIMQQIIANSTPPASGGAPVFAFSQDGSNFACTANPCVVTFSTAISANSIIVAALSSATPSDTITAISGGGGTSNICAASGCQVNNTALGSVDIAYSIATGGGTTVSITDAASNPTFVAAIEIKCTSNCGSLTLDAIPNSFGNSTSCGTCTAAGFTGLTGTSDAIVQFVNYDNAPITAPSGGYTLAPSAVFIYHLNSAVGTAPTITQSPTGNFVATGVAIK